WGAQPGSTTCQKRPATGQNKGEEAVELVVVVGGDAHIDHLGSLCSAQVLCRQHRDNDGARGSRRPAILSARDSHAKRTACHPAQRRVRSLTHDRENRDRAPMAYVNGCSRRTIRGAWLILIAMVVLLPACSSSSS